MDTFIEKMMGQQAGEIATIRPDYIVINDGVSHGAVSEIKSVADADKVWVIYDHDVPTGSTEAAEILKQNLAFANQYGCHYVQAQGIGYQYMINEVVTPGQIVVGGGSHGSIFGAGSVLGLNVSIPELARVVETGRFSMIVPETVSVDVTGDLPEHISIIDAALTLLATIPEIRQQAVEIYCPQLTRHQQTVLCSMAGMTGAVSAVIVDQRPEAAFTLALETVEPMVMMPCKERANQNQAEIVKRSTLAGTTLQAGQIGGYTGGTIDELRIAADMIKGQQLALGFRLTVCPATSRDYIQAMQEGIITAFIDFGAQISAAGDHSVVAQGAGAMGPKEKLVTTGLYTFAGAMGCEDAEIYTASVETVISAAITKQI